MLKSVKPQQIMSLKSNFVSMKKKFIYILIGIITVALIGFVAIQFYWINSAIALKEDEFFRDVKSAMYAVTNKLEKIERGKGERFKLWFKMSRKYSLVLIIEIDISKGLKVISAWNTDRKWQDKLKQ